MDVDITQFDEDFCRIYKKLHGKPPADYTMTKWYKGLRLIFSALAGTEANISIWEKVTVTESAKICAKSLLKSLDRRVDKAWAFNYQWRHVAVFAENRMLKTLEEGEIKDRFMKLMEFARLTEGETNG